IGCGTGQSTRDAARAAVLGSAVGVDISHEMLERARIRAAKEGLQNVTFEHGDAQVHPFPPSHFDVVISRFGTMFFADPVAAFDLVRDMRMTRELVARLDSVAAQRALARLRDTLAAHETSGGVLFDSRAWIVTAGRAAI